MISTVSPMLLLALVLGTCMASGVLLLGFRGAPKLQIREAAAHWFAAITTMPLGWVLLEWAIGGGPGWVFVLAKTAIMFGFVEFLRAARRLRSAPRPDLALHGLTGFVLVATLVWLLGWPQVMIRSSLLSLLCAAVALWTGYESWSESNRRTSAFSLAVGAGLGIAAAALLLRAVQYASPWAGLDRMLPALPPGLLLGLMLSALVIATLGFALLLSDVHLRSLQSPATGPADARGAAVGALHGRAQPLRRGSSLPLR